MAEASNLPSGNALVAKLEKDGTALSADDLLAYARWTETAERYDDMCAIMKKLVETTTELEIEQRNMLSVAYKNVVGKRRSSWRVLCAQKKEELPADLTHEDVVAYQAVVENELTQRCNEVLELLKNKLIDKNKRQYYIKTWESAALQHPYKDNADQTSKDQTNTARVKMCFDRWKEDVLGNQTHSGDDEFRNWGKQDGVTADDVAAADKWFNDSLSPNKKAENNKKPPALQARTTIVETLVFYLKMCGDYYRYLAEINPEAVGKKEDATNSSKFYKDALLCASTCLEPTHPTRLGLSLNMSVCHYEILDQKKEACALAKEAFDLAIAKLDSLNDSNYKDSTLIMQLLRDNLTIWTAEDNADGTGDDKNMA